MALHPVGDQLKIKMDGRTYDFGPTAPGSETGIVVEVPEIIHYFGKHSQMMEASFMTTGALKELLRYFKGFTGKRVVWEALQDRGRHFKEGDDEFILLKMSDIIGFTDKTDEDVVMSDDDRTSAGSFNL